MSATAIRSLPTYQEPEHEPARVMVADPDGLARRMIQTALQNADGILPLPMAADAREVTELARYYQPTILILDTALLPDGNVELISELRLIAPHTRIVTISAEQDDTALAALRAGAIGHISKDINPHHLARLITLAAHGEAIVPRRLTTPLLDALHATPDTGWRPTHSRLTTREWEIIELLDQHTTTQQIAKTLVVSPATVYSHIKSVMRKLDVHTRRDAITAAQHLRHQETQGDKTPHHNPMKFPDHLRPSRENS
jgi:two-component system, NarL family, nitrate/nitrite response regulator NarL